MVIARKLVDIVLECQCKNLMYYDLVKKRHCCRYCKEEKILIKEPEYDKS